MGFMEGYAMTSGNRQRADARAEKLRTEAQETQTLRKLMSIYEPERKDQFTSMSLADLRGESLAYAGKATVAKERQETMKAKRDEESAQSMQALVAALGQTTPTRFRSSTMPGVFPDAVAGTRPPVTAARVREMLPSYPGAANSGNLPDLLRVLQSGEATDETGGDPRITEGPFGTKLISDFRGRGTPQVVRDDKQAEGFIELPDEKDPLYGPRIRLPLSQAREKYPHLLKRLESGGAGGPASQYKSADDVKAAVKAGTLKKDEAVKILQSQFGYK
jgi:hypothetical protein